MAKKPTTADSGKTAIKDDKTGKPVTLAANAAEVKEKHGVKVVTDEQGKHEEGMHVTSAVVASDETKRAVGIDPAAKPTDGMTTSENISVKSHRGDTTTVDPDEEIRIAGENATPRDEMPGHEDPAADPANANRVAKTTNPEEAEAAHLDELKRIADKNDIGYGATIGADTLGERLEEAGIARPDVPAENTRSDDGPSESEPEEASSKYGAATDDDGKTVTVTVDKSEGHPNPVRLNVNGHRVGPIWHGEPTDIPRSALGALKDSGVPFKEGKE